MAMLIIYGCQKQNTNDIEPINTSGNLTETTKKIITFKDNMAKAKLGFYSNKSGEGMVGIDSAEWYLEAAINYTYDDDSESSPDLNWETKTATITIENNEVDMLQLAETYDALIAGMVAEGNYLAIADIEIKDDEDKASSKKVVITAGTASKNAPPPDPIVGDAVFEDYWIWGGNRFNLETGELYGPYNGSGYCDPPNNQIINNIGSTDLLRIHTKASYPYHKPKESYWTNVTSYFISPLADEGTPNYIWFDWENNYLLENTDNADYDWLVYYKITPGTPCTSPEELDYYINHGVHILIDRLKPEGYEFANIITSPEALWSVPPAINNYLYHTMRIFYGEPVMHSLNDGSNQSP
jgi:hypothetical protein